MAEKYRILVKVAGHNIQHTLTSTNLEDAREEQIGFANTSDNGIATLTTDKKIADNWEANCYHLKPQKQTKGI